MSTPEPALDVRGSSTEFATAGLQLPEPGHAYPACVSRLPDAVLTRIRPRRPKTNWWAVVSFVLGLVGVIVLSVICGLVGLSQAKRVGSGRGFAIAGLVLSGLWLLPFAAIVVYGVTSGLTSDTDIVSAEKVEVGDCLAEIPEDGRVETVETVDCRDPTPVRYMRNWRCSTAISLGRRQSSSGTRASANRRLPAIRLLRPRTCRSR